MKSKQQTFTYQTKLMLDDQQDTILSACANLLGKIERTLFSDWAKGKRPHELKNHYLKKYGITARHFNAIRTQVEGKIASIQELQKSQLQDLEQRKTSLINTIKKLQNKKNKAFAIHQKKRRLARMEGRINTRKKMIESGKVPLCFGSKDLFRKQFDLKANGYKTHEEWRKDWRNARNAGFFFLGSKDETAGNQSCAATIQPEGLSLRLRLPDALSQHGKYLEIKNVHFKYGHAAIVAGLESCKENKGVPISYRFKRNEKGWSVFVSLPVAEPAKCTREGIGVIGVDINADHLAVVETDRFGNPIKRQKIPLNVYGKTQNQSKAIIGNAVTQIVDWSCAVKKPIILEDLSFQEKKAELHESGNKKYARMLSSFAYKAILMGIKSRAWRFGVQVKDVNPAYTSIIGRVKFAKRYGLSIHQSAALCVARRFLKVSERLPRRMDSIPDSKGGHVTLLLPARNRSKHVWSTWRGVKKKLSVVLAAHFRARNRSSNQRKLVCCDKKFPDIIGAIPIHEPLAKPLG